MSLMGVAGKIVVVLLIALAVTEGISLLTAPAFKITDDYASLTIIATIAAVVGFALNLAAAFEMLSAHKKGELATGGLYAWFLNPMYAFQLLLTVPGLLLLLNSWLALATVAPTFVAFKMFAKEEERYLEERFGGEYTAYRGKVLFKFL
ncbi:MAG TPA: methyltransferase [Clostridia bacterium]|nr:methyltransferase [Clostridia bacterium]